MFRTDKNEERGQVGIGTLIVFIALVLVAAIAAGVLINTAGFLQSQAEATGEESTNQVSDGLQIQSSTAEVSSSGNLQKIELKVSLAPGSDSINVTQATIEWVGEDDATTLQISNEDDGTANAVTTSNAYVPSADAVELTSSGDTTTIIIGDPANTNAIDDTAVTTLSNDLPMTENDEATVTVTTRSGGQTVEELRVPNILENGEGVDL